MDWYVDNVSGNNANNGHSPALAKVSILGITGSADFTVANSPHNVYIKATGVTYTTNDNCAQIWDDSGSAAAIPVISINRYSTDTGTNRPVFDKSYSTTASQIWGIRGTGSNSFTVRNIHFKGKNSGVDANALGLIYVLGATAVGSVTFEYCIMEQRFSYATVVSYQGHINSVVMRYCHVSRDISIQNDTTSTKGAITRVVATHIKGCNVSHTVFENFVFALDLYHGVAAGLTYVVDHCSFVNCGRTANGRIIQLGDINAGDSITIRNNISVGDATAGAIGVVRNVGVNTYTADHNDWYQINTPYSGAALPSGTGDQTVDPQWQGGAQTWQDPNEASFPGISLTTYYAPDSTNYTIVLGDSSGAYMGAVYALAYMPAPTISPAGGSYSSSVSVSITSSISGTTIRYTDDGSDPSLASPVYAGAFNVSTSATIKARSYKTGYEPSGISSETYNLNLVPNTPIPITVGEPTIPALGGLPCINNDIFKRLKTHLKDDNIYDVSEAAIGITNYTAYFTGNVGDMPVASLTIYRSYRGETHVVSTVIPDADGNYSFSDKLPHGRAYYYAVSSDGLYHSNAIHINSYNIHVWLCAYASELLFIRNETAQARQNGKIDDGFDFDGNLITTDGYYLSKNFGQYISSKKLESMTRAEYQQLLLNVLAAYDLGPSVEAIDLICEVFTGVLPDLLWHKDVHGFPTTTPLFRVAGPPSLVYEWDEFALYFYDRWYLLPAGSGIAPAGSISYIYVDGTTDPATCDDRLSVLASGVHPWRYEMTYLDVIPQDFVRVDTDGTNTGVSGELYTTLSRFPLELLTASGSAPDYVGGITSASLVEHTSNIDLGIAQDDIDKTLVFGDVTVQYLTNYEYRILAVIGSDGAEITGITECGRIDGSGAVSRDVQVHHHCGILRINGSSGLSDEARLDLFNTLRDIKPAQKYFYIFMENAISGEMEYYGKI